MLGKSFDIVATTLNGFEPLLKRELLQLGCFVDDTGVRSLKIVGDLPTLYKLNLESRLALRFLVPVLQFHAGHPDEFYKKVRRFPWSKWMSPNDTFAIDAVVNSPVFRNSRFMLYRCKDGIVDHFVNKGGPRPSIDTENPTYRINLHISDKAVDISLDSSGESLHKRGYRELQHAAPLSEVLAAGMIDLSGWDGRKTFLDGMTGSGTLAIEAALKMTRRAPGLSRGEFGFERWKNFDAQLYERVRTSSAANTVEPSGKIIAFDCDRRSVASARKNAENAGVGKFIEFRLANFMDTAPPEPPGVLFLNPPYGERISADVVQLYSDIGSRLKHAYAGWQAWIISANIDALKRIGLKPMKKYPLKNGPLDASFRGYELFAGKRAEHLSD